MKPKKVETKQEPSPLELESYFAVAMQTQDGNTHQLFMGISLVWAKTPELAVEQVRGERLKEGFYTVQALAASVGLSRPIPPTTTQK